MTFIAHSLGCSFKKNVCRVNVVLDTTNGAARMLASWSLLLCGIYCGHSKQSLFLNVKSAMCEMCLDGVPYTSDMLEASM